VSPQPARPISFKVQEYFGGRYVPIVVSQQIQNCKYTIDCLAMEPLTGTEIRITVPNRTKFLKQKHLQLIEDLVYYTSAFVRLSEHRRESIQVYFYPSSFRKTTQNAVDGVFGVENVNSAYTQVYVDDSYSFIVLYRQEEACKVLIHELVHLYRIDRRILPDEEEQKLNRNIKRSYKLPSRSTKVREAVTEACALILCTAISSFRENKEIKKEWKKQIQFALSQVSKIIRYQGMQSLSEIRLLSFQENTHVFAYYILKTSIVYDNCSDFVNTLYEAMTGTVGEENVSMPRWILSKLNSEGFHKKIENKIVNTQKGRSSLRMTLF
jgi:hypothetical protein